MVARRIYRRRRILCDLGLPHLPSNPQSRRQFQIPSVLLAPLPSPVSRVGGHRRGYPGGKLAHIISGRLQGACLVGARFTRRRLERLFLCFGRLFQCSFAFASAPARMVVECRRTVLFDLAGVPGGRGSIVAQDTCGRHSRDRSGFLCRKRYRHVSDALSGVLHGAVPCIRVCNRRLDLERSHSAFAPAGPTMRARGHGAACGRPRDIRRNDTLAGHTRPRSLPCDGAASDRRSTRLLAQFAVARALTQFISCTGR